MRSTASCAALDNNGKALFSPIASRYSSGSTVTRIRFGNGFGNSYLSTYTVPTTGRRPSALFLGRI